jgi:hypothetical protein
MKISRKPTPPRPTAPSRPSRLVTADTALARAKISGMGLGGPNWLPELPEGGSSGAGNLWDWIRRDHYRYAGVIGRLCQAFTNAMAATAVSYPELSRNRTSPESACAMHRDSGHRGTRPIVLALQ